ncbi:MAG: glycosyltransferase family 2 protein [Kiritimatiellia bacterium]
MKTLTIGIPTFGRDHVLGNTIRNVLQYMDPDTMELIVADQNPTHSQEFQNQLQKWQEEGAVRWLRLDAPCGTRAKNEILRLANADIVLFLDDDVILPESLFREHLEQHQNERIAAVTGQCFNCCDSANPPCIDNPNIGTLPYFERVEGGLGNSIAGGNCSVKRRCAFELGGFDENFIASQLGEDMDFARRLLNRNYLIYYNPNAWLIHLRSPIGGCTIKGSKVWAEWTHTSGLFLYAFRHGLKRGNFWKIFWMALRNGPLRGEILVRPWRLPWALGGMLKGLAYGIRHRAVISGINGAVCLAGNGAA